jgi:hypothetical protein
MHDEPAAIYFGHVWRLVGLLGHFHFDRAGGKWPTFLFNRMIHAPGTVSSRLSAVRAEINGP